MASTLASPAGSTPTVTPQSVVVLRASEPPSVGGEKVEVRTGLKTLSNDLSELLVRNLSLKRNEELVGEVEQNSSDSVSLIGRNRVNNRNSLCDTFSSVNKLIKLKRVSSDLSGYGGKSLGGSDVHSINPPPQAKFKRVEVCVQELPRELVAPRKSVIVNQFDQLELDEGGEPLVIDQASSELPKVEEGIARRIPGIEPSDSVGKVVRRRAHHPAKGGRGSTLESVEEEQQRYNRRSLQWPLGLGDWGTEVKIVGQQDEEEEEEFSGDNGEERKGSNRNHFRHSWNAPGYDLLLDEERRNGEDSRRDFASIVHNLAGLRSALTNGGTAHLHHHPQNQHESASLLESPHSPQITAGSGGGGGGPKSTPVVAVPASGCVVPPSSVVPGEGSHVPVSLGGPVPRKRRLEAFLKSLVGRRPSKEPPPAPPPAPPPPPTAAMTPPPLLPSPEIKISRSPSDHNLAEMTRSRLNISTTSLSSVHQRLWSVVPLLKKDVSCTSLAPPKSVPLLGGGSSSSPPTGMRKCETVLALTHSMQTLEQQPIQPKNRLRNCASVATCSRCSSLLSLAAAGSRYSLNLSNGGFVAVPGGTTQTTTTTNSGGTGKHVGSLLRLASTKGSGTSSSSSCSANSSPCASSSSSSSLSKSSTSSGSRTSVTSKAAMLGAGSASPTTAAPTVVPESSSPLVAVATLSRFTCKLCLGEYGSENLTRISQCGCSFCTECMTAYVEFEISEGAYEVSCPDAMCPAQGIITISEITTLASASLVEKHHRYRLNRGKFWLRGIAQLFNHDNDDENPK
uniref:RBR-type E3 ubiquitin transferase n=1 Tax=Culex pipiens TaxID=7175 RepID=A0A8D8IJ11_CULPI